LTQRAAQDDTGDAVLDEKARRSYQQRIRDLQEEVTEAEDANDLGRASRAREELDTLVETLSGALGLGGRKRRLGSLTERARTTATWRIRHAIRAIETAHRALGRHLGNASGRWLPQSRPAAFPALSPKEGPPVRAGLLPQVVRLRFRSPGPAPPSLPSLAGRIPLRRIS
jgi:hypothetical protein